MSELAIIEPQSAPAAPKRWHRLRISKSLRKAIELLASGECKTQKAAAERAGLNESYLCKALKKANVGAFIANRAAENIARGTLRASSRYVELIDAASEHVSANVSERFLEQAGVLRQRGGNGVNVNVSTHITPGYVINLARRESPVIDADYTQSPDPVCLPDEAKKP